MPRPGNSQHSTKVKATVARPFAIRFVNGGWQVQQGSSWRLARELSLLAPTIAVGVELRGDGVVTRHHGVTCITA